MCRFLQYTYECLCSRLLQYFLSYLHIFYFILIRAVEVFVNVVTQYLAGINTFIIKIIALFFTVFILYLFISYFFIVFFYISHSADFLNGKGNFFMCLLMIFHAFDAKNFEAILISTEMWKLIIFMLWTILVYFLLSFTKGGSTWTHYIY